MALLTQEQKEQRQKDTMALFNTMQAISEQVRIDPSKIGNPSKTVQEGLPHINGRSDTEVKQFNVQKQKEDRLEAKVDIDTAQIKRDRAKRDYEAYMASDEKRQRDAERNRKAKQDQIIQNIVNSINGNPGSTQLSVAPDEKEQALRGAMEQAEAEYNASEDRKVIESDLEAITGLSDEERQMLEQYAVNQIGDQNRDVDMVGVLPNAQQQAAPLIQKYGQQRVNELAESYMRQQNADLARQVETQSREFADKHGVIGSALTVPVAALSGVVGTVGQLQGMARGTGRYATLDPNATGTIGDTFTGTIRGQVGQNLSDNLGGGIAGNAASIVYQGVMSAADSLARAVLGGGAIGGATLAATGSFSQTMADASRQGATPAQAALLATATAGIEALSEKIPLDKLVDTARGSRQTLWQAIKTALAQAGIEAATEEVSLLGSLLAEAAILREKSPDMTFEELLGEVVNTALVSMVSGGISSLGGSYANARGLFAQDQTQNNQPQNVQEAIAEAERLDGQNNQQQQEQALQNPAQPQTAQPTQQQEQPVQQPVLTQKPKPTPGEVIQNTMANAARNARQEQQETQTAPKAKQADQPRVEATAKPQTNTQNMVQKQVPTQKKGKTVYYDSSTMAPGRAMFTFEDKQGQNIPFTVDEENYADLDLERQKDKYRTLYNIASELDQLYDIYVDGEKITDANINEKSGYYSLADADIRSRPKINPTLGGQSYFPGQKGELQLFRPGQKPKPTPGEVIQNTMANAARNARQEQQAQSEAIREALQRAPETPMTEAEDASYQQERAESLDDQNAPPPQEKYSGETTGDVPGDPFAGRDWYEVGKRNVKAYMYENPEVKPFFQAEAQNMLMELADTQRGERFFNEDVYYQSGGEKGYSGVKRNTSDDIAYLLDTAGFTYDQIEKGLKAIIQDEGAENNAVSKRIEFVLNDRLMQGHNDFYSNERVPASQEYIDLINEKQITQYSREAFDALLREGDRYASPESAPSMDTQMGANNQSTEGGQIKGTGAAESNFSGKPVYNATLSEDNAQPDRRDDVRPMELPQQDINGGNVSAVTGNVYGSKITPDDFASLMEEPTAKGDFSYAKITNDQATQRATETIASAGTWENAYDSWKQSVTVGNAGTEMSARGALFLNHAAQQGNKQLWLETLHYMQKLGTNTAQGLQAFRIIRTLKPVDKIEFVKMSVEKMATEVREEHGIDLEIDQTLIDEFEQAETDADRDAVLEDIQQNVADQIPSTFLDKWTALRYMNMLGNLKTNVRNVAGNIGSATVYRIKDTIATGMETIASKLSGGSTERTKSLFVRKSLLNACKEDFQQFKETVSSGGKYGERMSATSQFEQGVQDKRRIFKNSALEAYRRGTNWMMNNGIFGDEAFGRAAYSRALAGYLQANGVTGSDLSEVDGTLLDRARAYAIKEAQEATFHDNSTLAQIVSKVQKDTGIVGQGLMPFTKTLANVLTRAEEFSPLGLINSTVKSIQKARGNENITGADVINSWAKSVTGVGLFALGAAMMDQGLLAGGPDEDEEKAAFDELNGQQNYAIQLPDGTNYTIDWLTPAAMPMFMGAQFWKLFSDDRDLTFADMEQVFTSIADPMIQMSMLQGLNDSLDGIKYSDNNLGQFFINAAVSYLTQGLTNTLMGQLERSTEENRQTTYIDKDSSIPLWMQQTLGKASQKIPGWDYQQMDYRNAFGQTEKNEGGLLYNLLSPGYISTEQQTAVTRELNRLRETTGENVFPQTVERSVNFTDTDGTKHTGYNLSEKEYETMQKVQGQTSYRLMFEVISNPDYAGLTDKQKAQVIDNIYSYAQEEARKQALPKYYSEAPAWMREIGEESADGLIRRAALSTINTAVTNTVDNIENGWTVTPAATQDLNALYDAYDSMSQEAKKQILDDAISDTAKYLEIRSRGISTDQYLDVVTDIKALKPEPNYSAIRDIQTREAIAENDSLSRVEKDYVMKAYMTDYDPTAKSPEKTELKYDAIRDLGVSPEGYTAAYRDYLDAIGTGKRRRTIALYMNKYGWDRSTAQKVYDLYAGYWKPWKE